LLRRIMLGSFLGVEEVVQNSRLKNWFSFSLSLSSSDSGVAF
jgi:hypothetical protein